TSIYTLSLHDALPICLGGEAPLVVRDRPALAHRRRLVPAPHEEVPAAHQGLRPLRTRERREEAADLLGGRDQRVDGHRLRVVRRSEEHTSELQSLAYL